MRAVLVIDIPDDYYNDPNLTDWAVDYDLRYVNIEDNVNESLRYVEDVPLRPLPEKKEYEIEEDTGFPKNLEYSIYCAGRNECIDEITGDK